MSTFCVYNSVRKLTNKPCLKLKFLRKCHSLARDKQFSVHKKLACNFHIVKTTSVDFPITINAFNSINRTFSSPHVSSNFKHCSKWHVNVPSRGFHAGCSFRSEGQTSLNVDSYMECSDELTRQELEDSMLITTDFISEVEENQLFDEIEPYLKRLRYEGSHWDDAIHDYRETERKVWSEKNKSVIQRVRDKAFPPGVPQLTYVHVLDLKKEGYIKPHVDAVKFCGNTIAGICLLSPSIMRLVHNEDKTKFADFLLERRSLYIMKDAARYNYTHEILKNEDSIFNGKQIIKDRRISIICRNEPQS
ncbi:Alpha-ketoglutarate-dependent dioxygenase alkB 7 [Mactra antiquata]